MYKTLTFFSYVYLIIFVYTLQYYTYRFGGLLMLLPTKFGF